MGLDTSHNCWHGPYSAFTRFRNALAETAGYEVVPESHGDGLVTPTAQIDWAVIELENPGCYQGEWSTVPDDPLIYLIAHSDCDGVIHPPQAALLADRLAGLLPRIVNKGLDDYCSKTEQFIRGLRNAAAAGEDVEFS